MPMSTFGGSIIFRVVRYQSLCDSDCVFSIDFREISMKLATKYSSCQLEELESFKVTGEGQGYWEST